MSATDGPRPQAAATRTIWTIRAMGVMAGTLLTLVGGAIARTYQRCDALQGSDDPIRQVVFERRCHAVETWQAPMQLAVIVCFACWIVANVAWGWQGPKNYLEGSWLLSGVGLSAFGLMATVMSWDHGYTLVSAGALAVAAWSTLLHTRRQQAWRADS